MKFARYLAHGQVSYGIVEGDSVREITTTPFEEYQVTDHVHGLSEVKLLAPSTPRNLVTTGVNTLSHANSEQNKVQYNPNWTARTNPMISIRNIASIIGHEDAIIRPKDAPTMREEAELVVVIGKCCHGVPTEDIPSYILGYAVGNDVTVKEWEYEREGWRAKCCDTFHPIGPWIETDLDPRNVMLRARINGVETQAESTASYMFDVPALVSCIARYMTLYPGDMVFTGTVGEPADCKVGDVVEVEAEGVGVLRNHVVAEE